MSKQREKKVRDISLIKEILPETGYRILVKHHKTGDTIVCYSYSSAIDFIAINFGEALSSIGLKLSPELPIRYTFACFIASKEIQKNFLIDVASIVISNVKAKAKRNVKHSVE